MQCEFYTLKSIIQNNTKNVLYKINLGNKRMKKTHLITILTLILGAISFVACEPKTPEKDPQTLTTSVESDFTIEHEIPIDIVAFNASIQPKTMELRANSAEVTLWEGSLPSPLSSYLESANLDKNKLNILNLKGIQLQAGDPKDFDLAFFDQLTIVFADKTFGPAKAEENTLKIDTKGTDILSIIDKEKASIKTTCTPKSPSPPK